MADGKGIDDQFRSARRQAAKRRTSEDRRVVMPAGAPPGRGLVPGMHTGCLECRDEDGSFGYFLVERRLRVGTAFEMYTNAGNGWIRGRFEWAGDQKDPPKLAMNLWNPKGPWDEDGLPPWIGEAELVVPDKAICRFPKG
jgi:hypothetical protein